jgi:hypothetical protein
MIVSSGIGTIGSDGDSQAFAQQVTSSAKGEREMNGFDWKAIRTP